MDHLVEEAFLLVMLAETSSYHLYCNAAATVSEEGGKEFFQRLAREEFKLIDEMLRMCPPGMADSLEKPEYGYLQSEENEAVWEPEPFFHHLRIALLQKDANIQRYLTYGNAFRAPEVARVFQRALSFSRDLYRKIAQQYRMADQSGRRHGAHKRAKRTHLRGIKHPSPNRHTQLFVSLQDSGRPTPL